MYVPAGLFLISKIVPLISGKRKNSVKYTSKYTLHEMVNTFNSLNPLSANPTKWSNTLRQFVGYCNNFVGLALKGLTLSCIMLKNGQKLNMKELKQRYFAYVDLI